MQEQLQGMAVVRGEGRPAPEGRLQGWAVEARGPVRGPLEAAAPERGVLQVKVKVTGGQAQVVG